MQFSTKQSSVVTPDDWNSVTERATTSSSVAKVEDYHVTFTRSGSPVHALRGVNLEVGESEIVALVGESGSGKSVLGLSMLGLLEKTSNTSVSGKVFLQDRDIALASAAEVRRLRREYLGAIFQDPMTSLNPTMRIGKQLGEVTGSKSESLELLQSVGIPEPDRRMSAFPFELSGGLRQRVMIAMALAGRPKLIVADEPTTALDVTVQAQILDLIKMSRKRFGTSFVLITHDLGVAAMVADRVVVMYGGEVVESGTTKDVLNSAKHPYTRALLASRVTLSGDRHRRIATMSGEAVDSRISVPGCAFEPRCPAAMELCNSNKPHLCQVEDLHEVSCLRYGSQVDDHRLSNEIDSTQVQVRSIADGGELLEGAVGQEIGPSVSDAVGKREIMITANDVMVTFKVGSGGSRAMLKALRGASLQVGTGEAVAVVGESGSGKSTLLRAIAGLNTPSSGQIELRPGSKVQMVFQDSGASLTPWMTVEQLLDERLVATGVRDKHERQQRILAASDSVGLYRQMLSAKAYQLSGGQRQRAALARSVVVPPEILLCDEPTSALDVSLAAVVLNLISNLRKSLGMTLIFVTHDLAVARVVADRIAVMYLGQFVEVGSTDQVLSDPTHPYTKTLLSAVPDSGSIPILLNGDPASPLSVPSGCSFHPRCPSVVDSCSSTEQYLTISPASRGHLVACGVALGGQ